MLSAKSCLCLSALVCCCLPSLIYADSCPSVQIVKDRKISRAYAWYIDERRTLEDVLAVEKLYSARLKNNGEYVRCYYSGNGRLLEMDAWPLKAGCSIVEFKGEWEASDEQESVCNEEDVSMCQFALYCDERGSKK